MDDQHPDAMSFACPHFDVEKDYCLTLQAECVPGRAGCVLRRNSVFYVPVEERLPAKPLAANQVKLPQRTKVRRRRPKPVG